MDFFSFSDRVAGTRGLLNKQKRLGGGVSRERTVKLVADGV